MNTEIHNVMTDRGTRSGKMSHQVKGLERKKKGNIILNGGLGGFSDKETLEQRPEGNVLSVRIWDKSVLGRGLGRCKGPKAEKAGTFREHRRGLCGWHGEGRRYHRSGPGAAGGRSRGPCRPSWGVLSLTLRRTRGRQEPPSPGHQHLRGASQAEQVFNHLCGNWGGREIKNTNSNMVLTGIVICGLKRVDLF